jgi:hypothetical protein
MSEHEMGMEAHAEVAEAPAEARKRHADLSLEITEADHRYYILDSPTISDIDYDTKMRELRALEEQYPGLLVGPGDQARRQWPLPVRAEDRRAGHRPRLPGRRAGQGGHPGRRAHR